MTKSAKSTKSSKTQNPRSSSKNFWGDTAASTSLPKASKIKREPRKFDWRWLVVVFFAIGAFALAFFFNTPKEEQSTDKITDTIVTDNSDTKINWERYQTVDIELSETITITESGTYHLTGQLTDGQIIVDAGVSEVRLLLDNATIYKSDGPAILCYNAENLVIETIGTNYISDGSTYSSDYDPDVVGAIYSKADLAFGGSGTLHVTSNYQDAIVGKDDVKFNSGSYIISAADDGIRGKDSVYIVDGDLTINSVNDAIKSNNETDRGKGFVLIENGQITIETNAQGIKAYNTILIYGGRFNIDSYDDAIHSDNYIAVIGGDIEINAGDDGIHADRELIIDDGNLDIVQSYEGIEAQVVTINGGDISIKSADDGINAGGGSDTDSTTRDTAKKDPFYTDDNCILSVNDGHVYINSGGDGTDSNGKVIFNGGEVIIDGPTNNGNGALDSGGGIEFHGGTVIALGSSGMAETLGNNSDIFNISVYLTSVQSSGTKVEIKNSNDETIIKHTSAKTFNHLAAGSEKFTFGETYSIYLNDNLYETFTISDITTVIGNNHNNFNNNFHR